MIKQKLQQEMIIAMKNKDNLRLSTIRLVVSKIKEKEINSRDNNSVDFDDSQIISLMQGMIKQRQDSAIQYEKANRLDLANKEIEEIKVIRSFMPALLSLDEIEKIIEESISIINPEGVKDLGKVIALIKEKYASQIDMAQVSAMVKSKLNS